MTSSAGGGGGGVEVYPGDSELAGANGIALRSLAESFNAMFKPRERIWLAKDVYRCVDEEKKKKTMMIEELVELVRRDWRRWNVLPKIDDVGEDVLTTVSVSAVVTVHYVRDCIEQKTILPRTSRIQYAPIFIPSSSSSSSAFDAAKLSIATTGYRDKFRDSIYSLAKTHLKAEVTPTLSIEQTHLIAYEFSGKKHDVVRQWLAREGRGPTVVNHLWIEDCIRAWKLLPVDKYLARPGIDVERVMVKNHGNHDSPMLQLAPISRAIDDVYVDVLIGADNDNIDAGDVIAASTEQGVPDDDNRDDNTLEDDAVNTAAAAPDNKQDAAHTHIAGKNEIVSPPMAFFTARTSSEGGDHPLVPKARPPLDTEDTGKEVLDTNMDKETAAADNVVAMPTASPPHEEADEDVPQKRRRKRSLAERDSERRTGARRQHRVLDDHFEEQNERAARAQEGAADDDDDEMEEKEHIPESAELIPMTMAYHESYHDDNDEEEVARTDDNAQVGGSNGLVVDDEKAGTLMQGEQQQQQQQQEEEEEEEEAPVTTKRRQKEATGTGRKRQRQQQQQQQEGEMDQKEERGQTQALVPSSSKAANDDSSRSYRILLTGMRKAERTKFVTMINRKIKESKQGGRTSRAGAPTIALLKDFEHAATHVVYEHAIRSLKILLGCCQGSWLLSSSWLTASANGKVRAGFVDEEKYEMQGNESGTISKDCARFWRTRRMQQEEKSGDGSGDGAERMKLVFPGIKVCFCGKIEDKKVRTPIDEVDPFFPVTHGSCLIRKSELHSTHVSTSSLISLCACAYVCVCEPDACCSI